MFHVEHSDVASDKFFAKIPILPIRHKNCAIRDFTPQHISTIALIL